MDHINTIVIGAGVVGLAAARALALSGREVLVVESESAIGTVTTARNSGVIHAGFYYASGSYKARLCVEGNRRLYAYAAERGIPHKRCGKLVVATDDTQIAKLKDLLANAEACGVPNMRMITAAEAKAMEPQLTCTAALLSPDTGLIDVHPYLLALQGDAEDAGMVLALNAPMIKGEVTADGFVLDIGGGAPMQISCRELINAAGLNAQDIGRRIKGLDPATVPPQVLGKGNYFSMSGKSPFQMLIYPLPGVGSLGLHATCDLGGRMRFGPDVEWVDHIDYRVDPSRVTMFEESIRHYWPALPPNVLQPDYSGIRPKLAKSKPNQSDFLIQTPRDHKVPNLINLYGIESPGLTSSLALADEVARLLEQNNT